MNPGINGCLGRNLGPFLYPGGGAYPRQLRLLGMEQGQKFSKRAVGVCNNDKIFPRTDRPGSGDDSPRVRCFHFFTVFRVGYKRQVRRPRLVYPAYIFDDDRAVAENNAAEKRGYFIE